MRKNVSIFSQFVISLQFGTVHCNSYLPTMESVSGRVHMASFSKIDEKHVYNAASEIDGAD